MNVPIGALNLELQASELSPFLGGPLQYFATRIIEDPVCVYLEKDHRWLVWGYHYQQFCLSLDKLLFPNSLGMIKTLVLELLFSQAIFQDSNWEAKHSGKQVYGRVPSLRNFLHWSHFSGPNVKSHL